MSWKDSIRKQDKRKVTEETFRRYKKRMKQREDPDSNEKVEIDSQLMHLPKYDNLKMLAMYELLLRHYSVPELEDEVIDMMEKIANK